MLLIALLSFAIPGACPAPGETAYPRNVILFVADDVGTDLLEVYEPFYPGTPTDPPPPPTPAIDSLVEGGMLFTNAWTNPSCSPTRAQILTGKHARRTGIGHVVGPPDQGGLGFGQALLPHILRGSPVGYTSAALGKWHLADRNNKMTHPLGRPAQPWFDLFAGTMFNVSNPGPGYNNWQKTFATTIDPFSDECSPAPCQVQIATLPSAARNYATADTADDAIYLAQNLPEPWFIYVSFQAAHVPLNAPALPLSVSACNGLVTEPACVATPGNRAEETRCMLQWLDNELGRILCALSDPVVGPDLPVTTFFIGDNGTSGDRPDGLGGSLPGAVVPPFDPAHGKGKLFQGGVNVPLIASGAGVLAGQVCDELVNSTDLFATIAEIAGVPNPNSLTPDSISIVRYLEGTASFSLRRIAYAEAFTPNFEPDPITGEPPPSYRANVHQRAARTDRYKLIIRLRNNMGTLAGREFFFDLKTPLSNGFPDVYEQNDLMGTFVVGDGSELDRNYRLLKNNMLPVLPIL